MAENERLKKVIFWLISQGIIKNQEDLAQKMGYNPSSLSQIVSGIKPLSRKFANKLASISEKININYLYGNNEMLKSIANYNNTLDFDINENQSSKLIEIIYSQQKTIEILAGKIVEN